MSVKDRTEQARASVEQAYTSARTHAVNAYDSARTGVRSSVRRTGQGIEENPLLALTGGLALGLIIGTLLPRSEREKRALSRVGSDINSRARNAFDAAREAGSNTLKDRGLTPERGEDVLRDVVKGLGAAARDSADAATQAVKRQ